jgi:tRNA-specific 2-thiouridylase
VLLDVSGSDDADLGAEDLWLAARLTARFGHGRDAASVDVCVTDRGGGNRTLTVPPLPANEIPAEWYL